MSLRLHPGEEILFVGHPSWRAMLSFHLKGLAAAAVAGLAARLILGGAMETFLAVLAVLALTVLLGAIRRQATAYTVTDRRLNIRRGIISREIQETRLDRISEVGFRQGPMQRLLRIGDVDFHTAPAGEEHSLVLAGVARPADVVHRIDSAAPVARHDREDDRG